MKYLRVAAVSAVIISAFIWVVTADNQSFAQTSAGTLSFSPNSVKNGGSFNINLQGGPANTDTNIWVNNGSGFVNFGSWVKTDGNGNINVTRSLDCSSYQTLTPGQSIAIGNRQLTQTVYLEFVGKNQVSSTATHTKDCTLSGSSSSSHPSGKTVQGSFDITNGEYIQDGENYFMTLSGAPVGVQTKLWVADDGSTSGGYQDFGSFGVTSQSNTAYTANGSIRKFLDLDCSNYEYIEPGRKVNIMNRVVQQNFYVEYVGLNKVSPVAYSAKDCIPTGRAESTGDKLFPYTLESIWGRNHIVKPFPDSFASGLSSPLKSFVGRYFDGKDRGGNNMNMKFEWYSVYANHRGRTTPIRVTDDRIYILMDSTLAAYNKNTFLSRLANSSNNSLAVFEGTKEPNRTAALSYDNAMVPWDYYLYPEHKDNAWKPPYRLEIHTGMKNFDVDDRGYIYFQDSFGFGIAQDSGSDIKIVTQVITPTYTGDIETTGFKSGTNGTIKVTTMEGFGQPKGDITIIKTGGKYYAAFTSGAIVDVTEPINPRLVKPESDAVADIIQVGNFVALRDLVPVPGNARDGSKKIKIYTANEFVNGGRPSQEFASGSKAGSMYRGLAVDSNSGKLYSVHYDNNPRPFTNTITSYTPPKVSISVFSPNSNGTYTEALHDVSTDFGGSPSEFIYTVDTLDFNNGYLISYGRNPDDGYEGLKNDIRLWIFNNGVLQNLDTRGYVAKYYDHQPVRADIRTISGKDYLFLSSYFLGDVYELEPVSRDVSTPLPTGPTNPLPGGPGIPPFTPDPDILTKPCSEAFAGNPALISLCTQLNFVQGRSCELVPGLPFCSAANRDVAQ